MTNKLELADAPWPGKTCGDCTLCCKALSVRELGKPAGRWCQHANPGCGIYDDRPESCRTFTCQWLTTALPDRLKPNKCGCVIWGQQGDDGTEILTFSEQHWGAMISHPELRGIATAALRDGLKVISRLGRAARWYRLDTRGEIKLQSEVHNAIDDGSRHAVLSVEGQALWEERYRG